MKTAESITPKHPDKICDRISDAILDECLRQDPDSRVAVETMGGHGKVTMTGEITTKASIDIEKIVKEIIGDVDLQVNLVEQSREIARGVNMGGAGDQGVMIGYASRENKEMIPEEYRLARSLAMYLYGNFPEDGKTQITIDDTGSIKVIVASFANVATDTLKESIKCWLNDFSNNSPLLICNPSGDWHCSGFNADTGLTGRKIVVDAYGPRVPVGGGSFSGKDPSKVDRSGAYMARYIAVQELSKRLASEIYVYLAYSIGLKDPIMAMMRVDGRGEEIKGYNLSPEGIIALLELKNPIYQKTAEWGHFGRGFKWDKYD